jgi:ABC-type nitrate/sulfonate/bicarbonate transport system substrate-binding protein
MFSASKVLSPRPAGVAAAAAVTLLLAACSSGGSAGSGSGDAPGTYKVSVLVSGVSFAALPVYVMQDPAFAKQTGVTVTLAPFNNGGGSTSQVFAGGTGDVLYAGIDGVVSLARKTPVTVIGTLSRYAYFTLAAKSGSQYKSVGDLKGATISVSGAGSFGDYLTRNLLKKNGLDPASDVKIAGVGAPPAQLAALTTNRVQASNLLGPTTQVARNAGQTQVIHDYEDDGPLPSVLFTGRRKDVSANPDKYAAFMKAYVAAVDKLRTDEAYALTIAKSKFPSTSDEITKEELAEFLTKPGVWSPDGTFSEELYGNGKAMLVGSGGFPEAGFPTYGDLTTGAPAS